MADRKLNTLNVERGENGFVVLAGGRFMRPELGQFWVATSAAALGELVEDLMLRGQDEAVQAVGAKAGDHRIKRGSE